jgi:glucosamine kinase
MNFVRSYALRATIGFVQERLYLGIDGGATKTHAVVVDGSGAVVAEGTGGPANATSGPAPVLESVAEATRGFGAPAAVAACLAGAVGEAQSAPVLAGLARQFPGAECWVGPDWAALPWAAGEAAAAVVLAGTGSAVVSMREGQAWATGGGGPLLGDQGSAFDAVRRYLGTLLVTGAPPSEAIGRALEAGFGTASPREVAGAWATAGVLAADGSADARRAVTAAMEALAHGLRIHLDAAGHPGGETPVELAGGLWDADDSYSKEFQWALSVTGEAPVRRHYSVRRLQSPPALGAARLAMKRHHGH